MLILNVYVFFFPIHKQNKDLLHFAGQLETEDAISEFSDKFITETKLVKSYISHLRQLELKRQKREESRRKIRNEERRKTYADYDWENMYRSGQLKKLKVPTLDLYIKHHRLNCRQGLLKSEKIDVITAHIIRFILARNMDQEGENESDEEEEEELEDAIVMNEIGSDTDNENSRSEDEDETDNGDEDERVTVDEREIDITELICTTRSGRTCRTWRGRSLFGEGHN